MKTIVTMSVVLGVLLCMGTALVQAQTFEAAPQIYRLNDGSTYQYGCWPPCLCPLMEEENMKGLFTLTATGFEDGFKVFKVSDANWMVDDGAGGFLITGSGEYRVSTNADPIMQRMELDLVVDGGEPAHFDSGLVPAEGQYPDIKVTVSINGMYCLDTVLRIDASRVPPHAVIPYQVLKGSTYQHGCWPPCLCPMWQAQEVVGTFGLVELDDTPLFKEYAVVNVDWSVLPLDPAGTPFPITGSGIYRIGGEVAPQQQMGLDLHVDGGPLTHFDSGYVWGGADFPRIDITMSVNGFYCYDQVIHLIARPAKKILSQQDMID